MDSAIAPHEFKTIGYVLEFDDNGDIKPKPELPDYTIFTYDDTDHSDTVSISSIQFSSAQDGVCTLGKTHMHSTWSVRSFTSAVFERVSTLV